MSTALAIKLTNDRKTRGHKNQKNAFGLLPGSPDGGGSCPGATTGPGGCQEVLPGKKNATCYVENLMKVYKGVALSLKHNTDLVKAASEDELVELFCDMFTEFERIERKRGILDELWFRHHWSGDMVDEKYCRAIKTAMARFPEMNFWTYTRSWFAVPILKDVPNLVLYISADKDNMNAALKTYMTHEGEGSNVALCYMGREKADFGKKLKLVACPVDNGKMELDQACHKCKLCLKGKPIYFKTK